MRKREVMMKHHHLNLRRKIKASQKKRRKRRVNPNKKRKRMILNSLDVILCLTCFMTWKLKGGSSKWKEILVQNYKIISFSKRWDWRKRINSNNNIERKRTNPLKKAMLKKHMKEVHSLMRMWMWRSVTWAMAVGLTSISRKGFKLDSIGDQK